MGGYLLSLRTVLEIKKIFSRENTPTRCSIYRNMQSELLHKIRIEILWENFLRKISRSVTDPQCPRSRLYPLLHLSQKSQGRTVLLNIDWTRSHQQNSLRKNPGIS